MHFEFLVEEPSAEQVLDELVAHIVGDQATFNIYVLAGKQNLLKSLPTRLKSYRNWLPNDWYIVVLVDEDRQDCLALKQQLEQAAHDAGLLTKSAAGTKKRFQVINRIVVEELEAWFFGDVEALVAAFPRLPRTLARQTRYRDPDAIQGGTAEALERLLQKHGYQLEGLRKIEGARRIAEHMDPDRNRSKSFQVFRDALRKLVG